MPTLGPRPRPKASTERFSECWQYSTVSIHGLIASRLECDPQSCLGRTILSKYLPIGAVQKRFVICTRRVVSARSVRRSLFNIARADQRSATSALKCVMQRLHSSHTARGIHDREVCAKCNKFPRIKPTAIACGPSWRICCLLFSFAIN